MHTRILNRAFSAAAAMALVLHSLIAPLNATSLNNTDRARAAAQVQVVSKTLDAMSEQIDAATHKLQGRS